MKHTLFTNLHRLSSIPSRHSHHSHLISRALLHRSLSTSPPSLQPPATTNVAPSHRSIDTASPPSHDPLSVTPQLLTSDPPAPILDPLTTSPPSELITATDPSAATAAVSDAVSTAATLSWSDTLLQPAITLLTSVHDISGLPWWVSIAVSTVAIRSLLLPVTLLTMRNSAKMGALKPDIADRREKVMQAVRTGDRPLAALRQQEMQDFMRGAGVAPMKVLAGPLVQFPVFISFFVGLRRLSEMDPSFVTGGVGWFVDLAARDPTYTLPIFCGMSLLAMTELGGDSGSAKLTPGMKTGMRAIAFLSVPMTYWFPAAVFCYWIPNNMFSVLLGMAVRTRPVKRGLGLDVDLKQIRGTKAQREFERLLASEGHSVAGNIDTAAAVASYVKGGAGTAAVGSVREKIVKPVVLRKRPTKKKKKVKTAN